jgi:nitroreductase
MLASAAAAVVGPALAQPRQPIALPRPRTEFGVALSRALTLRRSTRAFAARPLPAQVLSELLWCAYGVNRPETKDRAAPSWRHALETDIFLAMADSGCRYDPIRHQLEPSLSTDIRASTGVQDFVGGAPLDLIYVSNGDHLGGVSTLEQHRVAAADVGFIGQNVYLYCASEGLACVFRGSFDAQALGGLLGLGENQFVTFTQTVGYPKS